MIQSWILSIAFCMMSAPTSCQQNQFQRTLVSLDIQVVDDVVVGGNLPLPYTEPHLAADGQDPDHLLVASIVGFTRDRDQSRWGCAIMVSRNGGASWSERQLDLGRCADPWVALDGEDAWFASLHDLRGGDHGLAVYDSSDGGSSWDPEPVVVGRGHDHPTMVFDDRGGVYVIANYLSRGRSFVSVFPLNVSGLPQRRFLQATPAVANTLEPVMTKDGSLVVLLSEFSRFVNGRQERIEPSRIGATSFLPDSASFTELRAVTRRCGSGNRKGFGGTAIDESGGRFDQRIYHACISLRAGDIVVVSSDDGGATWGSPVRVLGFPEPEVEGTPLRRAPGIAVNGDGAVAVVWQDRGEDPDRRCQVERFAVSLDGGASFSGPVNLSSARSCPDTPQNRFAARQWPAGSDYGSIVALSDGRFRSVWSDARNGIYQVRMATVAVR